MAIRFIYSHNNNVIVYRQTEVNLHQPYILMLILMLPVQELLYLFYMKKFQQ